MNELATELPQLQQILGTNKRNPVFGIISRFVKHIDLCLLWCRAFGNSRKCTIQNSFVLLVKN